MNSLCRKHVRLLLVFLYILRTEGLICSAQIPPTLDVQYAAGHLMLTITGKAGTLYSIQCAQDISVTNVWTGVTLVQLLSNNDVWTDPRPLSADQRFYRALAIPAPPNTNFVFIQPGSFQMGSPTNELDRSADEGPQTTVTISAGFWIGAYPVTQGQYEELMGINPSYFSTNNGFSLNSGRPVEQVSWDDATNFCAKLSLQELASGQIPTNYVYRLPTEAEWEYACRSATSTRFSYGDDPGYNSLGAYAWYSGNAGGATQTAGQKQPNPWKLYDMNGNIWEWCQDWYGPYVGGSVIDPRGPLAGSQRVIRGGAWDSDAWNCRSGARNYSSQDIWFNDIGFRLLLGPAQP